MRLWTLLHAALAGPSAEPALHDAHNPVLDCRPALPQPGSESWDAPCQQQYITLPCSPATYAWCGLGGAARRSSSSQPLCRLCTMPLAQSQSPVQQCRSQGGSRSDAPCGPPPAAGAPNAPRNMRACTGQIPHPGFRRGQGLKGILFQERALLGTQPVYGMGGSAAELAPEQDHVRLAWEIKMQDQPPAGVISILCIAPYQEVQGMDLPTGGNC